MSIDNCPGMDKRYWKHDDIFEDPCPWCGQVLEFWKDDLRRRCSGCGEMVRNARFDIGCAKWCQFAEQCLGIAEMPTEEVNVCNVLIAGMRTVYGSDQRRIRHALRVLDYAEKILEHEPADPLVVRAAAILHDIGIPAAERKHGSAAGEFQQVEGPPIAHKILAEAGIDARRAEHVCGIVGDHHSASTMDTTEFRILWDADNLVNLFVDAADPPAADAEETIQRLFKTSAGRALALRRLRAATGGKDAANESD